MIEKSLLDILLKNNSENSKNDSKHDSLTFDIMN